MEAQALTPRALFDGSVQYVVSPSAGGYAWTQQDHWQPLWDEVTGIADDRQGDPRQPVRRHFLGVVVVRPEPTTPGEPQRRAVVDGQQRLVTLQLLIHAVALAVHDHGDEHAAEVLDELVRNPAKRFQASPLRFKLATAAADRDAFERILDRSAALVAGASGGANASAGAATEPGPVDAAHAFFVGAIRDWEQRGDGLSARDRLAALATVLQTGIQAVLIELGEGDDDALVRRQLGGLEALGATAPTPTPTPAPTPTPTPAPPPTPTPAADGRPISFARPGRSAPSPPPAPAAVPTSANHTVNDRRRIFWSGVLAELDDASAFAGRGPDTDDSLDAASGLSGVFFHFGVTETAAEVGLLVKRTSPTENQIVFDRLRDHRADIETLYGGPVKWEDSPEQQSWEVVAKSWTIGLGEPREWAKLHREMSETMRLLEPAIGPFLIDAKDRLARFGITSDSAHLSDLEKYNLKIKMLDAKERAASLRRAGA